MTALPTISGKRCIAALGRLGYVIARQKGSHAFLKCEGRPSVTVPMHRTLDRGTLAAILRAIELEVDEFLVLLNR